MLIVINYRSYYFLNSLIIKRNMKNVILILIVFMATVGVSIAQDNSIDSRNRLMFGLKAGINYSNVYDAEGEAFHADSKTGLAAGAFIAIPIGKIMGIQPEILFSQKGFKSTGIILGETYNLTRTTSYLDIPLLFSLKPTDYISVVAGPQFSYLIKQKDEFANTTTSIGQEQEFEDDDIRKSILGFTGGIDINISHLVFGARVGWDLQSNREDGSSTTPRYKNVWYQATMGFRLW